MRRRLTLPLLILTAIAWPLAQQRTGPAAQGAEPDIELVGRFDADGNKRLNYSERVKAREYLTAHPELRRAARPPTITRRGTPGQALTPKDVKSYPATTPLYDPDTVRTIFIQFERDDWEQELAAFWHTDVEVHAAVSMDGVSYRDVGVGFRGNNSFTMVPDSLKRSLSLSFDSVLGDQHLLGYRTLNLLNSNQDPTFFRSVLYLDVSRRYLPALKANYARVVINGEAGAFTSISRHSTMSSCGTSSRRPQANSGSRRTTRPVSAFRASAVPFTRVNSGLSDLTPPIIGRRFGVARASTG